MVKIRWTQEAQKWLRKIYNYIQDNLNTAERVVI